MHLLITALLIIITFLSGLTSIVSKRLFLTIINTNFIKVYRKSLKNLCLFFSFLALFSGCLALTTSGRVYVHAVETADICESVKNLKL